VISTLLLVVLNAGEPGDVLDLSTTSDSTALAEKVWASSPELLQARSKVAAARADAARAQFLPNPSLDLSLNTIPIGPTNPTDLKDPLLNVPNVGVALSVLLEIGKRGPRQDSMHEAARSAALDALEQLRLKVLTAEEAISDVAAAEVRVSMLIDLSEDAERLTRIQRARSEKGDTAPLDADRAQLEEEATFTSLGEARDSLAEGLRTCTEVVGAQCLPFGDRGRASAWLERTFRVAVAEVTNRPDIRSLEATRRSAEAAQTLAQNHAIPDPTLRVGYVHDRFTVSGNQQNSLYVGLTFPLPVFDHGQADAQAAAVAIASSTRARDQLILTSKSQFSRTTDQLANVEGRQKRLREQSVPLAQSVVSRLDAAVSRGAAPIQELLLARRSYAELLLTANDLDRAAFRLRVALARVTGAGLTLPKELDNEN
jgi:cobalt-zinc-cadmium efflux system outer membrane protein